MSKLARILVVDDEEEIRHLLVELLSGPDRVIDVAGDGQAALDRVHRTAYDVIISDIVMPGIDGLDLLQRVLVIRPETRVIVITGVGSTDWAKQAIRCGAFDYVEKPFDMVGFRELVERALHAGPSPSGHRAAAGASDRFYDPLTGLWTHRYFFEHLVHLRARCRRSNSPLSVLILDIDDFSEVNTGFGYAAGDAVLAEVAQRLQRRIRETDIAARYGSEEFVVALPETSVAEAHRVAERIRSAVRAEPFPLGLSERRRVTVSIGLAECETGFIESEDDLVRRAAEALQMAKAGGKDRCVIWQPKDAEQLDAPRADLASVQMLVERVGQINQRLKQTYLESTRALIAAVEAKDPYTEAHSMTVAAYAEGIARQMGVDPSAIQIIKTAALLHDIGKIGVPDSILTKPGKLSEAEWRIVKRHPIMAVQILEHTSFLRAELPIILYHHEWWNGSGYPEGLAGTRIPEGARILHVADAMEAMFSTRAYKEGFGVERVIEELRRCSGIQFDPAVAEAAIAWMRAHPDQIVYPEMRTKMQPSPVALPR